MKVGTHRIAYMSTIGNIMLIMLPWIYFYLFYTRKQTPTLHWCVYSNKVSICCKLKFDSALSLSKLYPWVRSIRESALYLSQLYPWVSSILESALSVSQLYPWVSSILESALSQSQLYPWVSSIPESALSLSQLCPWVSAVLERALSVSQLYPWVSSILESALSLSQLYPWVRSIPESALSVSQHCPWVSSILESALSLSQLYPGQCKYLCEFQFFWKVIGYCWKDAIHDWVIQTVWARRSQNTVPFINNVVSFILFWWVYTKIKTISL